MSGYLSVRSDMSGFMNGPDKPDRTDNTPYVIGWCPVCQVSVSVTCPDLISTAGEIFQISSMSPRVSVAKPAVLLRARRNALLTVSARFSGSASPVTYRRQNWARTCWTLVALVAGPSPMTQMLAGFMLLAPVDASVRTLVHLVR